MANPFIEMLQNIGRDQRRLLLEFLVYAQEKIQQQRVTLSDEEKAIICALSAAFNALYFNGKLQVIDTRPAGRQKNYSIKDKVAIYVLAHYYAIGEKADINIRKLSAMTGISRRTIKRVYDEVNQDSLLLDLAEPIFESMLLDYKSKLEKELDINWETFDYVTHKLPQVSLDSINLIGADYCLIYIVESIWLSNMNPSQVSEATPFFLYYIGVGGFCDKSERQYPSLAHMFKTFLTSVN
ncbi:hypothetical protein FE810_03390 [Thalassotalea litorea]|uniref:Uncharacterized protein n=1 Tax=Thalassotalea litorea TaxID=2020715 RepID=A0A5R9IRU1_9GAMM|nr:hypothetical protein [Thalassotalea litorea]TLU67339.1 hypothetical protein FE810_03390 [Thalassotalea litorea]